MNTDLKNFFKEFFKKFKWEFIKAYSVVIITKLFNMFLGTYILKVIVNKAKINEFDNLILLGLIYCFLVCMECLEKIYYKSIRYNFIKKLDREYVLKLFKKILEQEISFFNNNLSGQLSSKIFSIQKNLEDIFRYGIFTVSNLITIIIGFFIFYFISPKITYFSVVWFVCYLPITIYLFKLNFKISSKNSEITTKTTGIINDCFINIANIKMFNTENRECREIKRQSLNILRSESKKLFLKNILNFFNYVMGFILAFGIFSIVFINYMNNKTSIGSILLVSNYSLITIFYMYRVVRYTFKIINCVAKVNNSIKTLFKEIKIKDNKNAVKLNCTEGKIVFKNVTFKYDD